MATILLCPRMVFLLLVSSSHMVNGSRDANDEAFEVAAGSHFVKQKEIQQHEVKSANKITPEMRKQIQAFAKSAVQALANEGNPKMSTEDKAKSLLAAQEQAAFAVKSMASSVDLQKNPELAQHLANIDKFAPKKQAATAVTAMATTDKTSMASSAKDQAATDLTSVDLQKNADSAKQLAKEVAPPSLMQKRQDALPSAEDVHKHRHTVRAQVQAHSKAAREQEKLKKEQMKLALLNSVFQEEEKFSRKPTSASLLEERQESRPQESNLSAKGSKMTPAMMEQVRSFGEAASKVLANKEDSNMSPEEKSKHIQAALAKFQETMAHMASLPEVQKSPEFAEKLASLKDSLPRSA